jgi:uncharacterized membrane protein YfcA
MTGEHRWHAIEKVMIACGIVAIVGNFSFYFREGAWYSLFVGCLVTAMLLLFLWRRPRRRGDQIMDVLIRWLEKRD